MALFAPFTFVHTWTWDSQLSNPENLKTEIFSCQAEFQNFGIFISRSISWFFGIRWFCAENKLDDYKCTFSIENYGSHKIRQIIFILNPSLILGFPLSNQATWNQDNRPGFYNLVLIMILWANPNFSLELMAFFLIQTTIFSLWNFHDGIIPIFSVKFFQIFFLMKIQIH